VAEALLAVTAPGRLEGALRTALEWVVDIKLVLSCLPPGGSHDVTIIAITGYWMPRFRGT
jgi:hypothetical protein